MAGSPSTPSTLALYKAMDNNQVYQSLAAFRRLPVDVLGDSSALNLAFLETLTGQSVDAAKTTLLILDAERLLRAHTTIEALSDSEASLNERLVKFLQAR